MNEQTKFPSWTTRLQVAAVAVGIAMIAAVAIANVPTTNNALDYGSAFGNNVLSNDADQRKAFAAAMSGTYDLGFLEFGDTPAIKDDGLGPLSETSNPEILD